MAAVVHVGRGFDTFGVVSHGVWGAVGEVVRRLGGVADVGWWGGTLGRWWLPSMSAELLVELKEIAGTCCDDSHKGWKVPAKTHPPSPRCSFAGSHVTVFRTDVHYSAPITHFPQTIRQKVSINDTRARPVARRARGSRRDPPLPAEGAVGPSAAATPPPPPRPPWRPPRRRRGGRGGWVGRRSALGGQSARSPLWGCVWVAQVRS